MCSITISRRDLRPMTPTPNTTCDHCGIPIHRYPSRLRRNVGKYCSRKCSGLAKSPPVPPKRSLRERFSEKYRIDERTGCWLWTGAVEGGGYGVIWVNETRRAGRAHRVSHELHVGPIPDGAFVCHSCDTPRCVNPDHLWLGDATDNMRDMYSKGRDNPQKGDEHKDAVLTEKDVRAIRRDVRRWGRSHADVAREYGVTAGAILSAVAGVTWSHVDYWPEDAYAERGKKLNPQAVIVIRHMARAGRKLQDLADAYGIHYQTAYRVAAGLRWSHVDYPTTRDPVTHG